VTSSPDRKETALNLIARHTLPLILLICGVGFCFAQESNPSPSVAPRTTKSQTDSPQTFTSAEGGFTIALPAKPTEQRTEPVGDGKLKFHVFHWTTSSGDYTVDYIDTTRPLEDPKISKAVLDDARNEGVKKENGKLLGERDLNLDGHVGREFKIAVPDGVFIDRVYLVRQRFYSLTAFIPTAEAAGEAAVIKILDSFKLIERKETVVK
jgi:hypothetical protein